MSAPSGISISSPPSNRKRNGSRDRRGPAITNCGTSSATSASRVQVAVDLRRLRSQIDHDPQYTQEFPLILNRR